MGSEYIKTVKLQDWIRYYAEKTGIVILTDSDTAGFRIRGHIKKYCAKRKNYKSLFA